MSARYRHGQKWIRNDRRCAVYARDEFRCVYCGSCPTWREDDQRYSSLLLDHVEPFAGNGDENLVTVCDRCNTWKSDRSLDEWLRAREAYGEDPDELAIIRQRVAIQTFIPIDRQLGKRLEKLRGNGFGSFSALRSDFLALIASPSSGDALEVRHVA